VSRDGSPPFIVQDRSPEKSVQFRNEAKSLFSNELHNRKPSVIIGTICASFGTGLKLGMENRAVHSGPDHVD